MMYLLASFMLNILNNFWVISYPKLNLLCAIIKLYLLKKLQLWIMEKVTNKNFLLLPLLVCIGIKIKMVIHD